jgi:hypothetical protein
MAITPEKVRQHHREGSRGGSREQALSLPSVRALTFEQKLMVSTEPILFFKRSVRRARGRTVFARIPYLGMRTIPDDDTDTG